MIEEKIPGRLTTVPEPGTIVYRALGYYGSAIGYLEATTADPGSVEKMLAYVVIKDREATDIARLVSVHNSLVNDQHERNTAVTVYGINDEIINSEDPDEWLFDSAEASSRCGLESEKVYHLEQLAAIETIKREILKDNDSQ